jgi:Flp pilus assembly protein TadG
MSALVRMLTSCTSGGRRQRGSAMIEFTVVAPIITLLGLAIVQYGMLFFAKNQINHAGFIAAREGAMAHANLDAVAAAYARALVPLYGGGQTPAELASSLAKAHADLGLNGVGNVRIDLLNPTRESFADWNDPGLQAALKTGAKRVIPNANQAFKNQDVGASSGQTLQDANLIKLRITQGYQPKVPLVNTIYQRYLAWLDTGSDPFRSKLVAAGRIPVVTHVTLQMQSDAIEPDAAVSTPGKGGQPVDPGQQSTAGAGPVKPAPDCRSIGCSDGGGSSEGGGGGGGSGGGGHGGSGEPAPACNPLTDPQRCMASDCGAASCCAPA